MSLTVRKLDQKAVIDLNGMVHPQELQQQVQTLLDQSVNQIAVNFSKVNFVESSFLSALLLCKNLCQEQQGDFNLYGVHKNIQMLVELTRLNTILAVYPDETEALAHLGQSAPPA